MKVEIISIGDELVTGAIVDTNSAYLAEQSEGLGMKVARQCCIGDDMTNIVSVMKQMGSRSDVVLVTGGLGPTPDDLTSEAAAKASGEELTLFPDVLQSIQSFFKKIGKEMPEPNKKQAYFPHHAAILANPVGSAPGFSCKIDRAMCYFMPGVPREMKKMFTEQVLPEIKELFEDKLDSRFVSTMSTFGMSEAVVGKHLKDVGIKFPQVQLGTRFNFPVVQVKAYISGKNDDEVQSQLKLVKKELNSSLGNWIYADAEFDLASSVNNIAQKAPFVLSVVGDLSASYLIDWMTNAAGASGYLKNISLFPGNFSEDELISQLKVSMRGLNESSYGLAMSGVLKNDDKLEAGLIRVYCLHNNAIERYECILPFGGVEYKKKMFANLALDILRRKLLNLDCLDEILGKRLVKSEMGV